MTVPSNILNALGALQRPSERRISDSVITGMTQSLTQARYQLMRTRSNPNGAGFVTVPTNGTESLLQPSSQQAMRHLMTLHAGHEGNFTFMLNTALLGGESYPILNFVLGTAAGVASGGAGLLFGLSSLALDLSRTSSRILARSGDQLWQVEEIGKATDHGFFGGSETNVVHIGSYFLYDPYRHKSTFHGAGGWLIHEERTVLDV